MNDDDLLAVPVIVVDDRPVVHPILICAEHAQDSLMIAFCQSAWPDYAAAMN